MADTSNRQIAFHFVDTIKEENLITAVELDSSRLVIPIPEDLP
ncbi:MAG TPA: hypothetical protein PLX24_07115 [Bacteroidales bacterium]|nr:hypothetical protein [Bacteroidales bacterium]HRS34286.1 hypothetical protein [Bacteroidales bacterium]